MGWKTVLTGLRLRHAEERSIRSRHRRCCDIFALLHALLQEGRQTVSWRRYGLVVLHSTWRSGSVWWGHGLDALNRLADVVKCDDELTTL